ncbi:aminotransferase class V-fold PLP-dependent enzyme [Parasedimentitalea maritima]|uniref:Aminotransferase class V-fold PLP-dependent enzyme n=1 Tax=Parasedimentitalea maritima TaxID=2578117 RepID=A0ABY2UPR2_9RHOB|nr:aminotransferase class V-fold PLP-dependent enzyme [Zongyanglinia marina]TLP55962.1 aminotransferase class V-fold PLP-dependent enzyme [Zongyanglinia marina]
MTETKDQIDQTFVQSHFPGLKSDWAFFDNAGGSQTVLGAIEKVTEFLTHRDVQIGGSYDVSLAAAAALMDGRRAMQTMTNAARPEEIVFGHSTTALMQILANAMRSQFVPGDEIIISIADHESNIGPWDRLREFGIVVKFWPVDKETYALQLDDLDALMTERTKLVCVHHVSNILGQVNPIADYAKFVHDRGAKICVDAVAYAPHRAIDVQAWDVDYYVFSLYKCYGPHVAVMYGKYDLLTELDGQYHYFYGKDKVPGKLEPGNPNYELAFSAVGIVEYLAALGEHEGGTGTQRNKLEAAFVAIAKQEDALTNRLLANLRGRNDVRVIGATRNIGSNRVPTIAFRIDGHHSGEFTNAMDEYGIAIRFGDFHTRRLVEALGEDEDGGVIRVSMVHYNTLEQVDRFCAAMTAITGNSAAA